MGAKRITVVLLSDGSREIKQFKFRRIFFVLFFFLSFALALALAWTIRDYRSIKIKMPHFARLEKENTRQRAQLIVLAQKIDRINKKMIELKKFDHKLKVMVNLETDEDNMQFLGIGGSDPSLLSPDYTIEKAHKKLVRLMHQSFDNLDREISIQTNEKIELYKFLESQKSMLAATPSIWPAKGWISSRFGYRISPFTNQREFHKGIDVSSRMNAPIIAPADGVVTSIRSDPGYGRIMTIDHGYNLMTRYAHLSKVLVKKGQPVKRGEKIALVGKTGRTTGPHLHYEVTLNRVPLNPLRYILD